MIKHNALYKMRLPFVAVASILFLEGCASAVGSSGNARIRVIDRNEAAVCKYIGDTHGTSPFYGVFAAPALEAARNAAMDKAADMGGDSVAWRENETGYGSTSVHGDVYKCR